MTAPRGRIEEVNKTFGGGCIHFQAVSVSRQLKVSKLHGQKKVNHAFLWNLT